MNNEIKSENNNHKKSILKYGLIVVGLVAISALAWWAWHTSAQKNTLGGVDTEFAVADTAHINKIFISLKTGEKYLLERGSDGWVANNSWAVAPSHVEMLLSAIRNLSIRRTIGSAERDNVINSLATSHIKVEIYAFGQQVRCYYIGGEADDHLGSYALMKGSETPYVVHLAYFNGYLWPQFHVQPAWRSKQLFRTSSQTFQKLEVDYLKNPAQSFTIERKANQLVLDGDPGLISSQRLGGYLPALAQLTANEYVRGTKFVIDSLRGFKPQIRICLTDSKHKKTSLLIYDYNPESQNSLALLDEQNQLVSIQIPVFLNYLTTKKLLAAGK